MNDTKSAFTPEEWRTLKGLSVAVLFMQLLTPMLQSGVNVLLPAIGEDLGCSAAELGLIGTCYSLATAIFNLCMGRAGDKWGRRRVCLCSMVILAPMCLFAAFAPSTGALLGTRFLQGMGTAAFVTTSLAMLMATCPPAMRGRVLGITSTGVYIGIAGGPLVGGYVNLLFGWRAFFVGTAIWGAMCFFIMSFLVRKEWRERPDLPYDWSGFLFYSLGMAGLVMGSVGPVPESLRGWIVAAGAILIGLFIRHEYRCEKTLPLLDVKTLGRNRTFILSCLAAFTLYASMFAGAFFFSLYLQYAKGLDSAAAGGVMFIVAAVQIGLNAPAGWLSDRIGPWYVAVAGNALTVMGLLAATTLDASTPMWAITCILLVMGCGMGLFVTPNTVIIMTSVDKSHMSQASGMVGSVRTSGMVLSMVIATLCLRLTMGDSEASAENVCQFLYAMRVAFITFTCICSVSLLVSFLRRPVKKP